MEELFAQFKKLADKKKYVLDEDIIALVAGDAAKIEGRITRHKEREQIHGKDQGKWYSLARAEQGKLKN